MSNEVNKDWSHWIREDAGTLSGFGTKRQAKSGGTKTPVDTHPKMVDGKNMRDDNGLGRGYDKSNRPNERRNSIQFPGQNYSPTNPVARNHHLTKMWQDNIESNTKRMQKLQRPKGN